MKILTTNSLKILYLFLIIIILTSFSNKALSNYTFTGGHIEMKCVGWNDPNDTTIIVNESIRITHYAGSDRIAVFMNEFENTFSQIYAPVYGFGGVGSWDIELSSSMIRWENGTSCGVEGIIEFTAYDTTLGLAEGVINFQPVCFLTPPFRRVIGTFRFGNPALSLEITQGYFFNLSKGDSNQIDIIISEPEGNPADSAVVYVKNPFLEGDEFVEIGMVNQTGMISYMMIIPESIADGDYVFEFYAEKEGFASSQVVECTVNISKLMNIYVEPSPELTIGFQDTVKFEVSLWDDIDAPVEGAEVSVSDPIQTNGIPAVIGISDSDGKINYTLITNEEMEGGEYTLKFSAFKEGFSDTAKAMVIITLSAKLVISVSPDTTLQVMPKDTINYRISVKDLSKVPIEGAKIFIMDSIFNDNTFTEVGQTDKDGFHFHEIIIPEDQKEGTYSIKFYAKIDGYEDSDTVTKKVEVTVQSDCIDIGIFTICTNASNGWESVDPTVPENNKIKQEGVVSINGFLFFTGEMVLDTAELSLKATGSFYLDDIPLPGGGMGKYVLNKGSYELKLLGSDGIITNFYNSVYEEIGEFCGVKFKITNLELIGGRKADGIKMSCKLSLPGIAGDCGEPDKTNTEIDFNGLSITDSLGFTIDGLSIKNMGLFYPKFCLKELGFKYDRKEDKLAIGAEVGMPFGSVGGGFALVKGLIDSIGWRIDGGWPPKFVLGTSTVGISGFFGHISNITSPDLELELGGIFIDLTSEYLYSIDVSGKYKMPSFFELAGQGSFFKPPVGIEHWQLKGDISASYDFSNWLMELKGAVKIATQDGEKYLITGDGSFKMDNKESKPRFAGKFTGEIELPKFKDKYPYKWLNSMFDFPIKASCWTRFVYGKSKVMYGDATFSTGKYGPYTLDFVLNLDKSWGDEDYFWFKAESGTSNGIAHGFDGNLKHSVPLYKPAKVDILLDVDFSQIVNVPANTDLLVLNIKSETEGIATSLRDPNDNTYTETNEDYSVVLTFSEDNKEAFWTLLNPQPGEWTIAIQNPEPTDSLDVFVHQSPKAFNIDVYQDGPIVTVSWENEAMGNEDTVFVMLDNNDSGFDGFNVASSPASDGEVSFVLNDTMDACAYHIFALYEGQNDFMSAYSGKRLINEKTSLMPPSDIRAEYDTTTNIVFISWSPSVEEEVIGHSIRLVDDEGLDSLIADVHDNISEISFELDNPENKKIRFISYDENGFSGCPSEDIEIEIKIVDVEEFFNNEPFSFAVYPNPTREILNIKYNLNNSEFVKFKFSDIMGKEIMTVNEGFKEQGTHYFKLNIDGTNNGIYFCNMSTANSSKTIRFFVIK